jgi:hypothetical protein
MGNRFGKLTTGWVCLGLFRLRQRLRRDKLGLFWICFSILLALIGFNWLLLAFIGFNWLCFPN